jgi:hypothetical protein
MSGQIDGNYGCPDLGILPTGTVQSLSYTGTISLLAGEYIDFWNSYGSDVSNAPADQVGLEARIVEVPEPSAMILLAMAGAVLAIRRRPG